MIEERQGAETGICFIQISRKPGCKPQSNNIFFPLNSNRMQDLPTSFPTVREGEAPEVKSMSFTCSKWGQLQYIFITAHLKIR